VRERRHVLVRGRRSFAYTFTTSTCHGEKEREKEEDEGVEWGTERGRA